MNKIIQEVDNCFDCKYCKKVIKINKFICTKLRNVVGMPLINGHPIRAEIKDNGYVNISEMRIPDWCPELER